MRRRFARWLSMWKRPLSEDLREELESHLGASADYLIARGWSPETARAEAIRRLGTVDEATRRLYPFAEERNRTMKLRDTLASLRDDLGYTLRNLVRRPGFSAMIVLTIGLGIGANAAMFGIVEQVLLRGPAGIADAGSVRRLYLTTKSPGMADRTQSLVPYPLLAAISRDTAAFSAAAAYTWMAPRLGSGDRARVLNGHAVSGSYFSTLGVRPVIGRFIQDGDVHPGEMSSVAVISYGLWQSEFGGSPRAIGQRVSLSDVPVEIIGVAPEVFTGPELDQLDVWLPLGKNTTPFPGSEASWDVSLTQIVARPKAGVSVATARSAAQRDYTTAYAGTQDWRRTAKADMLPLRFTPFGAEPMEMRVSRWLFAVALAVLLTAFANVANLLLARGVTRQHEVAVRLTIGISRGRLVRLLMAEGAVLAAAGGIAGTQLGVWIRGPLQRALFPNFVVQSDANAGLALFCVTASLLIGAMLGLVSYSQTRQGRLALVLREAPGRMPRSHRRARMVFAGAQAMFSMLLLIGAGVFITSLIRVRQVDLGIEPQRVLYASMQWPAVWQKLSPAERAARRSHEMAVRGEVLEQLRHTPGVPSASVAAALPFRSTGIQDVRVPGHDSIPRMPGGGPFVNAVGSDYFRTLGSRLLAGREFNQADGARSPQPVIMSRTTARRLFGNETTALGRCVVIGADTNPCAPVIGIVTDSHRFALEEDEALQLFVPIDERALASGLLLARVDADDIGTFAQSLRQQIVHLDPSIAFVDVGGMQDVIDPKYRPWKLGATVVGVFGLLALVIAIVGLYSVVSYATAHRTHEIGVRIALGARLDNIVRMVMVSGLRPIAAGVVLAAVIAALAARWLEPLLFHTSARSPVIYATAAAIMVVSAACACVIPARRAGSVSPVVALRAE
jgi:predicted permease